MEETIEDIKKKEVELKKQLRELELNKIKLRATERQKYDESQPDYESKKQDLIAERSVAEGIKVIFFRIIYGLFIMLIMPIYNFIYDYAIALNPIVCDENFLFINQGVQAIKWIVFLGIAARGYHLFYRAVMLRAYESQYSQTMGPFGNR